MRHEIVETRFGAVPIWTRGPVEGPLVVAVRGSFPDTIHDFEWLEAPGARFAFLHLPGFHSPTLPVISLDAFVEAFDAALEQRFPGTPYVAAGLSVGALAAMRLKRATGVLAIEPFLRTGHLWPLFEFFGAHAPQGGLAGRWIEAIFGRPPEGRDYRGCLAGLRAPAEVVVGDVPLLPRRRVVGVPSLCDEADRAALAAHPGVRLQQGCGGHAVHRASQPMILAALGRLLVGG